MYTLFEVSEFSQTLCDFLCVCTSVQCEVLRSTFSRESQHTWEHRLRDAIVQTPSARKALRPPPSTATAKEQADYADADEVALGIARSSIPDKIYSHFIRCPTVLRLFEEVKKFYEPQNEQHEMELELALTRLKLKKDDDYITYTARASRIMQQLSCRNTKLDERGEETASSKEANRKLENKVCYAVLNGLDREMEWFTQMVTTVSPTGLKLDNISEHLQRQERLGAVQQEEANSDYSKVTPVFFTGGGGRGGGRGSYQQFGDQGGRDSGRGGGRFDSGRGGGRFGNGSGGGRFGNASGGGRSGGKDKSHIQCFRCNGWGHFQNECPNGAAGQSNGNGGKELQM